MCMGVLNKPININHKNASFGRIQYAPTFQLYLFYYLIVTLTISTSYKMSFIDG